jgi:hypothetical protein
MLLRKFVSALVEKLLTIDKLAKLDFETGAEIRVRGANGGAITKTISTTELGTLDGLTATAAELNMAGDNSTNAVVITAVKAVSAAESGTTFFIDNATGFASTLPAPALGLRYTFVNKTANTSGNHTVVTTGSSNIIAGGLNDMGGAAGSVLGDGDTISFVANQSVAGDTVRVISDGTSWFLNGSTRVAAGVTVTKAS